MAVTAVSHACAVELIVEGSGTRFDPEVVKAFVDVASSCRDVVYNRFELPTLGMKWL